MGLELLLGEIGELVHIHAKCLVRRIVMRNNIFQVRMKDVETLLKLKYVIIVFIKLVLELIETVPNVMLI